MTVREFNDEARAAFSPIREAVSPSLDACARAYAQALREALACSASTEPVRTDPHLVPSYIASAVAQYSFEVGGTTYSAAAAVLIDNNPPLYATVAAWIGRGVEDFLIGFVVQEDYSRTLEDPTCTAWVTAQLDALAAHAGEAVPIVAPVLRHFDDEVGGRDLLRVYVPGPGDEVRRVRVADPYD